MQVERTHDLIAAAFEFARRRGERGIQLAAYDGDELAIDEWTGEADLNGDLPVDGDTLFPMFSVTKAFTATALHVQAERGLVDYEAPIAEYWPEFAKNGKESITVRHVLTHRAGVPQMPGDVTMQRLADWEWMTERIAGLSPLFEPGSRSGYLAMTFGWLLGEVVCRTDPQSRDFPTFLVEEVLIPLGIEGVYMPLPEDLDDRVAAVSASVSGHVGPAADYSEYRDVAMPTAVAPGPSTANDPARRRAVSPAGSGIATARGIARLFAMLANGGELGGVRLLSEARVQSFSEPRDNPGERDVVLGQVISIGQGGFWLGGDSPPAEPVVGRNPRILCQPGSGGAIGWADPDARVAGAVLHNRMFRNNPPMPLGEHPLHAIGDAVRTVIAERRR